jgi:hypothetical protein
MRRAVKSIGAIYALSIATTIGAAMDTGSVASAQVQDLTIPASFEAAAQTMAEKYGLTSDEAATRMVRAPLYGELAGFLDARFSRDSAYGGAWIDHQAGGVLVVAATDATSLEAAVDLANDRVAAVIDGYVIQGDEARPPMTLAVLGIDAPVAGRLVSHSLADLERSRVAIDHERERLTGVPSPGGRIEPGRNRVLIGLTPDLTEAQRQQMATAAAALPGVEVVERPTAITDGSCPASDCEIRGGVRVTRQSGTGICSIGFTGVRNGAPGFFTAGHCPSEGTAGSGTDPFPIYQLDVNDDPVEIGVLQRWLNLAIANVSVDIAFYALDQDALDAAERGTIWTKDDPLVAINGSYVTRANLAIGDWLCRDGYRREDDHLAHCGELVSKNNLGIVEDLSSCQGDSGGPWWRPADMRAVGIHKGGTDDGSCPAPGPEDAGFTFLSDNLIAIGGTTSIDTGK